MTVYLLGMDYLVEIKDAPLLCSGQSSKALEHMCQKITI